MANLGQELGHLGPELKEQRVSAVGRGNPSTPNHTGRQNATRHNFVISVVQKDIIQLGVGRKVETEEQNQNRKN